MDLSALQVIRWWQNVLFRKEDIEIIIENAKRMERPVSIATAEEIVANGSDKDLEDYFAIAHHRVNVSEKFEEYVDKDVFQIMLGCDLEERKYNIKGNEKCQIKQRGGIEP